MTAPDPKDFPPLVTQAEGSITIKVGSCSSHGLRQLKVVLV